MQDEISSKKIMTEHAARVLDNWITVSTGNFLGRGFVRRKSVQEIGMSLTVSSIYRIN